MSNKPLNPNQLPRQRKKIEKDRRRKQYDDLQVQGTNNSSIVSKRSVEMIYSKVLSPSSGEWFQHFVKKPKRRSPAINRGYWIRMESIKQMILKIVEANLGKRIAIINLGCGFDPLPFQLLSTCQERSDMNLEFYDVDYPELIQNKLAMIKDSTEILSIVGEEKNDSKSKALGVSFSTAKYKLIGCDLKDEALYKKQLDEFLDNDCIKIFVAEVSLAYMKPEFANPIIEHSAALSNSHFLILEQILPSGKYSSFAQKMLYHFSHLRSPLQCVEKYPTKEDQVKRFKNYYEFVEINNLYENWKYLISDEMKERVETIEPFDEWEEFIIFCQHYVIVHASNINQLIYQSNVPAKYEEPSRLSVDFKQNEVEHGELLELKFPAVAIRNNEIIINGGLGQTRTDATFSLENNVLQMMECNGEIPSARMCHTMCSVGDSLVLIGGRSKPNSFLSDTYKFIGKKWTRVTDAPNGRCRHSTIRLNDQEILVFGGTESDDPKDLFLIYNVEQNAYRSLKIDGEIPNLSSCAMEYNGSFGIIVGGMESTSIPLVNDSIFKFTISGNSICIENIYQDSRFKRIGCQIKLLDDYRLLVVGGVSTDSIFNQFDSIVTFQLSTKSIQNVEIPDNIWKNYPPIFVGFGMISTPDGNIVILGGGAVCYSFGSCYNKIYSFKL